MKPEFSWTDRLAIDVEYGYMNRSGKSPRGLHPQVVLNNQSGSMLRTLREELKRSTEFTFSVAFVSPRAIALLKQEFVDFRGSGRIVTSDYLGFNSPQAFAELHGLTKQGFDIRIHTAPAFHPKGYIFSAPDGITAMVGSSNLTEAALVSNHEWNLKVSAAMASDLAEQLATLVDRQLSESVPLTTGWIEAYAESYTAPSRGETARPLVLDATGTAPLEPNRMQIDALRAIDDIRRQGKRRAIVISATGTGKTILSALDVRTMNPHRLLFVVHREQILDKTIEEYRRVLGGPSTDFGKVSGTVKQFDRRHLFATVQTLSQPGTLERFTPDEFDYLLIDEAHRAGAASHQRILSYFTPRFLMGMTATPERTDAFNVFELFDYNVPYEIRLQHALEADMLAPFHYYGIADVTFADGRTTSDETDLRHLVSPDRVAHLIDALDTYGQAGVAPRGLIFCSRKEEAHSLSEALNLKSLRGHRLRTVALTGEDSIARREETVRSLEAGDLDYIFTVDIFNEGVDIPTINQVVMLRQTQSAIVFVQQLGRGLRKAADKEYLVVIDFIGNYSNNYLVPIALFGDESLNKESLRKGLIAAEETGVLPGLSSVRFDKISQDRILQSIADTSLDSMHRIKAAIESMRNRVGHVPRLWDFLRFESVDPILLATKRENYPALIQSVLRVESGLSAEDNRALGLLSHEVLPAKRLHEFVLLDLMLQSAEVPLSQVTAEFTAAGLPADDAHVQSAIATFTLEDHAEADQRRYGLGVAHRPTSSTLALTPAFRGALDTNGRLAAAVQDLIQTGKQMAIAINPEVPFSVGRQYTRKEVTRLLCWPRKWTSTLYGYKVHKASGTCPIFVTLHKSGEVLASIAYEDALLDPSTMLWYTRSRRTLASEEVRLITSNAVDLHVFVKKDDAEGTDFYYMGQASSAHAEQVTMPDASGGDLDVVRMLLHFDQPIERGLFDYFHPSLTTWNLARLHRGGAQASGCDGNWHTRPRTWPSQPALQPKA